MAGDELCVTLKRGEAQPGRGQEELGDAAGTALLGRACTELQLLPGVSSSLTLQGGFPSCPAQTRLFSAQIPLGWGRDDHTALSLCPWLTLGRGSWAASLASTLELPERQLWKDGWSVLLQG